MVVYPPIPRIASAALRASEFADDVGAAVEPPPEAAAAAFEMPFCAS